ncbi:guanylate kinase-like protein [Leptomonas seymouri]|uniref:Guanylate kinase-like protein n=1 Tax=Leptomonas seymouri TaxID=5684 RepID=A0A0N1I117_LEPSE|nr:guanylate kinase-like protein [Leptomonas seymouri]|eukprot:KPI88590.1 guanylate kinase-like protein [Leptomonas seymouri]
MSSSHNGSAAAAVSAAAASSSTTITSKRLVDVLLFVGPSGCGKSTIITQILREWPDLFGFSVSHTTRAPRRGEVDGKHYHFASFEEFQVLINSGAMIEYSRLSSFSSSSGGSKDKNVGSMYGTSKESLHKVLNDNKVVLMDTDLLGAINIRRYCAHVVVDSKPITVPRKEKQTATAAAAAVDSTSSVAAEGRYVEVLPATTAAAQPAVAWQVPRLDVPAVQLKCHDQLPAVPPVSSMPNTSRLLRCMVIFIAPPNMQVLEERLRERKSETDESFRMRMELNLRWMRWAEENKHFFDYYIVNDNLKLCYERVKRIVKDEVLAIKSSL